MKLWLSGEIDSDVGGQKFGPAMRAVENEINNQLSTLNEIDIGVKEWDCIAIIRGDESFKEVVKYSEKKWIWILD